MLRTRTCNALGLKNSRSRRLFLYMNERYFPIDWFLEQQKFFMLTIICWVQTNNRLLIGQFQNYDVITNLKKYPSTIKVKQKKDNNSPKTAKHFAIITLNSSICNTTRSRQSKKDARNSKYCSNTFASNYEFRTRRFIFLNLFFFLFKMFLYNLYVNQIGCSGNIGACAVVWCASTTN